MQLITLSLWGQPFIDCLSLNSNFRANLVMQDDACLSYVHAGTQEIYAPSGKIVAKNGESILSKCRNFVADNVGDTPNSEFRSVVFHINFDTVKRAFEGKDISFLKPDNEMETDESSLKIGYSQLMENFVESLTIYFDNPDLAREEILVLKLQELVYILCDTGKNEVVNRIISSLQSRSEMDFEEIISSNLYNNLKISELSHLTARSESSFKRDFTRYYKVSPAKYFKTKRLEKAAALLRNSNLQVNEIAWDCGFENAAHFGTSFRSFFGQTPKEYRA
jgi:AraC-like DNA-binding protein